MEGQDDQHNNIPPPTPSPFSLPFLLPPQTPPPFLFTPNSSAAPSSSLMTDPPLLEPNQVLPEIDWVSLLSGTQAGGFGGDIDQNYRPNLVNNNNISGSGENINEGDREEKGPNSKRKVGGRIRRAASRPRFAFQTRSADDILDDGYRWRKYGQKAVKNSLYPRSYYRCTHHTCNVKKQVQRLSKDTSIVVTTYEGIHNHPCEKLMETLTPLLKQMQFLSRF